MSNFWGAVQKWWTLSSTTHALNMCSPGAYKPLSPTAIEQWLRASDFCRRVPPYDTGVSNSAT